MERFQASLLDLLGQAVIATTPEGKITYWNRVAETLYGWPQQEVIGRHLADVVFPPGQAARGEQVMQRLAAGQRWSGEMLVQRRDGTIFPAEMTSAAIFDAQGNLNLIATVSTDITGRKQAESFLAGQMRALELLATGAGLNDVLAAIIEIVEEQETGLRCAFYLLDRPGGRICAAIGPSLPPSVLQVADFTAAEPQGRPAGDVLRTGRDVVAADIESDARWSRNWRDRALTHGLRSCLASPVRGSDASILAVFTAYRLHRQDAEPTNPQLHQIAAHLAGIAIERKNAEDALTKSHTGFEVLFNTAPVGSYVVDSDLRIRLVNPQVRHFFGDIEGIIGKSFSEVIRNVWPQDDADQFVQRFRHTLQTGEPYSVAEFAGHRVDLQKQEYYEWQIHRILLPGGGFGVVCYFSDISRHVLARQALADADRRKTEFLAALGHELRNPLAPIRTGLELMKMVAGDPTSMEETRSMMERQTQQLIRLIDDLLDVSRITQGKLELRTCRVSLAEIIRSAVEASRPLIDKAGHELTVTVPQEPVFLQADPHRLAQVFSNLLNNSAKYTPEGGRIWLNTERQGEHVVVKVRDNGIGIAPDVQGVIFDMFAQLDRPLERGHQGLGIGLTLVKRLVEMHEGSVEVHSEGLNHGSEFSVRLPICGDPPETQSQAHSAAIAAASRLRVLIVDDNKEAADILGVVAKMLGNEVRTAYDGLQGIEMAAEFHPDVVLMDIGMPKMNGYDAARHIRAQSWGKEIILVALTGWGLIEDRRRSQDAGFDHHLVKPAEPAMLQKLLADLQPRPQPS